MTSHKDQSGVVMTRQAAAVGNDEKEGIPLSRRFKRIKDTLLSAPIHLCPERALLITRYYKQFDNPREPMIIRKAKAFRYLMKNKSVRVFPDELIAGNVGTRRKSAIIQPELAGVFLCQDLLWIDKRKTAPFQISWANRFALMFRVIPYWLFRNMVVRAFRRQFGTLLRYLVEQLKATYYLINEVAGIGHFLPNYERIIQIGIQGYLKEIAQKEGDFYRAVEIACEGIVHYAGRLSDEAERRAARTKDQGRAGELREIARICRKVPLAPADTFHEAVQSLWLAHMGVCLEGINSAVSFGRIDQYLLPFYRDDLKAGRMTAFEAKEILLSFSAKATEHVFLVSDRSGKYHGGFLVAQAAIVGGVDQDGRDATNALSDLFLDVMAESGLRDPNYQARIHSGTPKAFIEKAADVARKGNGVPAFFNDETVIDALIRHGYPKREARNYGIVGCVEPTIPGKSFLSTDAALFNLPLCIELALNCGRRFRGFRRIGAQTPPVEKIDDMNGLMAAFRAQTEHMVSRLIADLKTIERGNRDFHPTPYSSMLVDGCLESAKDITAGGALFNGSGVQGVGVADTADSLAALDRVVFRDRKCSLAELRQALIRDFKKSPVLRAELQKAAKFGNDVHQPDDYAAEVVRIFHSALSRHVNCRKGPYVPGFYSSTTHVAFGELTGALPSGRKAGEPFAASLGPSNGRDQFGPTAILNSVSKIDGTLAPNGYALNLRFDREPMRGEKGRVLISSLVRGFFQKGGMELQFNVLDPEVLLEARSHPGRYPGLVVRVAGYCAYFDDLPDSVQQEIISRNRLAV
jgi:formate C-acetyltransferase